MKDQLSYSLGASIGLNLKEQGFTLEHIEDIAEGIKDALSHSSLQITEEEINKNVNEHFRALHQKEIEKNQMQQKEYFEENLKNSDVIQLESGLQYQKLSSEGNGVHPKPDSQVKVHYHGTFIDGRVFDSSIERGNPITLPVNGVIMGWQEALQLMSPGDKWRLFVPSDLAYGAQGAGKTIPPHTPLIFEIDLISIEN